MKKLNKITYFVLILVIFAMGITIYSVVHGKNDNEVKSKALSQVKNTETKLVNLLNTMNHVQYENYKISVSDIKEESSSKTESSQENSGGSTSSKEENSSGNSGSSGESGSSSKQGEESGKKYSLEKAGILTQENEVNWDSVKSEVELMYTMIPTMTLDLYQTNVKQEDILKFNQQYDQLSKVVKEEDKEKTLEELAKVYEFIPKFIENCSEDATETIIVKTKSNIFKAYSILDKKDWNSMKKYIDQAIQEFSNLLTGENFENKNQYNINKAYIMLNELQNAIQIKDQEIFLIKYKNILEELNNL